MIIIETLPMLRQQIRRWRQEGKRIALVPTMGNLHDGHMTLVDEARARADVVVVSIFVNPMQFDRPDDLARYPRTLQEDSEKLTRRGVDLVFAPAPAGLSAGAGAADLRRRTGHLQHPGRRKPAGPLPRRFHHRQQAV